MVRQCVKHIAIALIGLCAITEGAFAQCSQSQIFKLEVGVDRARGKLDSQERKLEKLQDSLTLAIERYNDKRDRIEDVIAAKRLDLTNIQTLIECVLNPLDYYAQCIDQAQKISFAIQKQESALQRFDEKFAIQEMSINGKINRQQGRVNAALAAFQQAEARLAQCQ